MSCHPRQPNKTAPRRSSQRGQYLPNLVQRSATHVDHQPTRSFHIARHNVGSRSTEKGRHFHWISVCLGSSLCHTEHSPRTGNQAFWCLFATHTNQSDHGSITHAPTTDACGCGTRYVSGWDHHTPRAHRRCQSIVRAFGSHTHTHTATTAARTCAYHGRTDPVHRPSERTNCISRTSKRTDQAVDMADRIVTSSPHGTQHTRRCIWHGAWLPGHERCTLGIVVQADPAAAEATSGAHHGHGG
jgi:hypothetical protein